MSLRTEGRIGRRDFLGGAALLALGLLAGCGFHLRGSLAIPQELTPLYIQAPQVSMVRTAIEEQLSGSVPLATSPDKSKLILRIQSEMRSSRVVATDYAGKVLAYELYLRVTYDAVGTDGVQRIPLQKLDLVRTFDNPDIEVLGKQLEQLQINQELSNDAADRILTRLRTALY
jgi:LPS-assembly lipoprotein